MVPSPLARRQSASGSPEHVLVPTADCPEDTGHIIQPNRLLGFAQWPELRQREIEYRGDVPQNEAELPLRADGAQDKAHPAQGHDIAVCRGPLPIAQILSGTCTDSG